LLKTKIKHTQDFITVPSADAKERKRVAYDRVLFDLFLEFNSVDLT
jgi:hypothetical protein